jgi:RNA polymerase sigma factor (sigma-70 family)
MPSPSLNRTVQPSSAIEDADRSFDRRIALVEAAIDLHHTHLTDYLHSLAHNWHDAQDIAQELWKHVLLHFPEEKISQFGILRRKAFQIFVDHYRRRKRKPEAPIDLIPEISTPAQSREAASAEEEEALQERFWSELPGIVLTASQKECLWRHARYGYTIQEIATDLSIPKSTVADWVVLARRKIKEQFEA